MPLSLEDYMVGSALAFMLTFVRMGTAIMVMPGIGDSFVSERIRLHIALAISFVLFPLVVDKLPNPLPGTFALLTLIVMEFIIGLFFGTIARIFMTALDTAGMVVSFASSLSNAQVFNPSLSAQGSLVGAFFSVTGLVVLFATNLHHLLIMGVLESYEMFPLNGIPDSGSMAELVARAVSSSFLIGIQIGTPFLVMTLVVYTGMGVLSRLMPQVQVFMMALPVQIFLSLITLVLVLTAIFTYWATQFESSMVFFLSGS
jgi:flagellar biosynthetic protein FliR